MTTFKKHVNANHGLIAKKMYNNMKSSMEK